MKHFRTSTAFSSRRSTLFHCSRSWSRRRCFGAQRARRRVRAPPR
jgi:hypothetical protein